MSSVVATARRVAKLSLLSSAGLLAAGLALLAHRRHPPPARSTCSTPARW